jgi:diguanylate cyclase (GGDEF)-like protein
MQFHKSESAFFVFMAVVLVAGGLVVYSYHAIPAGMPAAGNRPIDLALLKNLLLASGVLVAVALFFGAFFIYPQIRGQAREEVKLREMTQSLSARSETLKHAALTDPLTGMHNRRYFDEALEAYLQEFGRIDRPVGLMVFDLDHFKQVNDTHGHDVGDDVLRAVGRCLKDMTRYHDVVARLGGEEFAVVAPNMDMDGLVRLGDRIRHGIAGLPILAGNIRLRITSSVGLALWDGKESAEEFFRRADQQLYHAKKEGRNRVSA